MAVLAIAAGAATLAGCVATVGAEGALVYGYPAVYVETVPVEITAYPRVIYRGRYAYLVGDEWYYPTSRGWVRFREEPVELRRYRTTYRPSPRYVEPPRRPEPPRERPRRYTPR